VSGRVLITGADGFVGSHLQVELGELAVPIEADVTDGDSVRAVVRNVRPAAIVHLAALSSVSVSWERAADVWRVNAVGTVNVLEAVRDEAREARVLAVSTGEVYGLSSGRPTPEDAPLAPVSPYAASKAAAEIACERAGRADGLDVIVVRAFSLVGPRQSDEFAVGSWTRQIVQLEGDGGGVLRVGDVSVERDLTDVRDACRALRLLLDPAVPAGTYNVASGQPVALSRVVDILISLARCPVEAQVDPQRLRPAEIPILCGDSTRLKTATGWSPEYSLEATLADALDAARNARTPEGSGVA
jgi:GDP-4-dehydro-6-deoxy-D-mannose reductase